MSALLLLMRSAIRTWAMWTATMVKAIRKLGPEIADQTVKRLNLGGDLHVIDLGHAIGGLDRAMGGSNCQDNVIRNRPNGVGDLAFDHEDVAGSGRENLATAGDGAFSADYDEEMIAGVGVRHEPVTSGEPDDVGAEQSV
jgi:hypothetical protein